MVFASSSAELLVALVCKDRMHANYSIVAAAWSSVAAGSVLAPAPINANARSFMKLATHAMTTATCKFFLLFIIGYIPASP